MVLDSFLHKVFGGRKGLTWVNLQGDWLFKRW